MEIIKFYVLIFSFLKCPVGILQSSVFLSTLFLLFIADIPETDLTPHLIKILQHADDPIL